IPVDPNEVSPLRGLERQGKVPPFQVVVIVSKSGPRCKRPLADVSRQAANPERRPILVFIVVEANFAYLESCWIPTGKGVSFFYISPRIEPGIGAAERLFPLGPRRKAPARVPAVLEPNTPREALD